MLISVFRLQLGVGGMDELSQLDLVPGDKDAGASGLQTDGNKIHPDAEPI